jgi:hypothetical protein
MNDEVQGGELVPIGVEALQLQAADMMETRRVLDRFGYTDTTFDQLVAQVRHYVQRSVEDMLEIGRAVCCFRELGRGRYGQAIAAVGLSQPTAYRLAEVALKFLGHNHRKPLLNLDRSKVYELALLDDSTLDEMATDPAKLDQVERMSVTELKNALREAKKNLDSKDDLIQSVQEDNSKLREKEIARTRYTLDQAQQDEAHKRISRMQAVQANARLILAAVNDFGLVLRASRDQGDTDELEYGTQTAAWLAQQVSNLYITLGIEVDFAEIITPSWTRGNPQASATN